MPNPISTVQRRRESAGAGVKGWRSSCPPTARGLAPPATGLSTPPGKESFPENSARHPGARWVLQPSVSQETGADLERNWALWHRLLTSSRNPSLAVRIGAMDRGRGRSRAGSPHTHPSPLLGTKGTLCWEGLPQKLRVQQHIWHLTLPTCHRSQP